MEQLTPRRFPEPWTVDPRRFPQPWTVEE
jgi:hypothetical protein